MEEKIPSPPFFDRQKMHAHVHTHTWKGSNKKTVHVENFPKILQMA